MQTNKDASGTMKLGGSLTRQAEQDFTLDDNNPHIANIGHMVEDMENKMRNTLNEIYFGKTKDIVNDLRCVCLVAVGALYAQGSGGTLIVPSWLLLSTLQIGPQPHGGEDDDGNAKVARGGADGPQEVKSGAVVSLLLAGVKRIAIPTVLGLILPYSISFTSGKCRMEGGAGGESIPQQRVKS
jgi:hypothetical protein